MLAGLDPLKVSPRCSQSRCAVLIELVPPKVLSLPALYDVLMLLILLEVLVARTIFRLPSKEDFWTTHYSRSF